MPFTVVFLILMKLGCKEKGHSGTKRSLSEKLFLMKAEFQNENSDLVIR